MEEGGPLIQYDQCPYKKTGVRRKRPTGRMPGTMKSEVGVRHCKPLPKITANTRNQNEPRKDGFPHTFQRQHAPAVILISYFWPPQLWDNKFLLF